MRLALALVVTLTVPAATEAADTPASIPFSVRSWFYEDVKDLLLPGDAVYAIASRGARRGQEPTWSEEKLARALSELAAVDMEGIERTLVLSTFEDLEREIADLPECVDAIAWNSEAGMTPMSELQRLDELVPRFAELCHRHGYRMIWGPTHNMLTRDPDLLRLAAHVDGIGLQHQRPLQTAGQEAFVALTRERRALIKSINPDCQVTVQVVLERTPASEAAAAFLAAADSIDRFGAWTMSDRAGLRALLELLRPVRQDRLP